MTFLVFEKLPPAPTIQEVTVGVERVNHTMAQILVMVVNECQDD